MLEEFDRKKIRESTLKLIEDANRIIDDYLDQGYELTLRQLYYRLVATGVIPNNQRSYKNLGTAMNTGRMIGLVDWEAIVDRVRETRANAHWDSPKELLEDAAEAFQLDRWEGQENHVEVMCEKDALSGVLEPLCSELDVPFTANRGYSSQSFMWRKGKDLERIYQLQGKDIHVLYLGDHDPSGLDMDRDIEARLATFSHRTPIRVVRLALLMQQIHEYDPPPDPVKVSDSRYREYAVKHGEHSWELDALEPAILRKLVEDEINSLRDTDLWMDVMAKERAMKARLLTVAKEF